MGFDLSNDAGTKAQWTSMYWRVMLDTAKHYGWTAPGTQPPHGTDARHWAGHYVTNDGQQVTNDDARSLAHHLRIAAEAPDVEQVFNKIYASYVAQAQLEVDRLLALALDPPGLLSRLRALFQRDKAVKKEETHDATPKTPHIPLDKIAPSLRELADFCDGGRFVIR